MVEPAAQEQADLTADLTFDSLSMDAAGELIPPGIPDVYASGPNGGACDGCGSGIRHDDCGQYCGDPGCPGNCGLGHWGPPPHWAMRGLSLFAGAHGFKGPPDQGRNGNFGLHEGVNFGSRLGIFPRLGYQVGVAAVHSNFSGDQANAVFRRSDRDQIFLTAGIFRRAPFGGVQWGIAFDLLHDSYFDTADLKQIRTETSIVGYGQGELGFWGAYGVGRDDLTIGLSSVTFDPTDMFAFFYRRYFENGGDGRFWGGFTGRGDGLLGADLRVPLGRSWALENRVNYLIPRQARGADGQVQESWGLSVQLVWYPCRSARGALKDPYRPMFDVADNSLFMSDRTQ